MRTAMGSRGTPPRARDDGLLACPPGAEAAASDVWLPGVLESSPHLLGEGALPSWAARGALAWWRGEPPPLLGGLQALRCRAMDLRRGQRLEER